MLDDTESLHFIIQFYLYHWKTPEPIPLPAAHRLVVIHTIERTSQVARPYRYEIPVVVFFIDEYGSLDPILRTFYGYPSGTLEQFLEFHP